MVPYDLKWSETVKGKLCSATKLLNKVSALVTWSSTDFVGINWCNWGVLLVAVTAFFLCSSNFSVASGGLYDIKRHPETTLHKKAVTATNKTPQYEVRSEQ
jgi:hypothetical protein